MVVATLRKLRHGPLKWLDPVWLALGKLYQSIVMRLPLKTKQMINQYGPFLLDAKFAFSNFANWGYGHNEGFVQCIEDCRNKACVLDIGAHIGLVTLPMSQVSQKVYAFEPAAANSEHLQHHILYNKVNNVEIKHCLIGAENKAKVDFFEMDAATGMNSRVIKKNHHLYHQTTRQQMTLDSFIEAIDTPPDLIKIDVEGAEYDVLRGAQKLLTAYAPIIYLSLHPKELSLMGSSVTEVVELLDQYGYHAYDQKHNRITDFGFSEYRFTKETLQ